MQIETSDKGENTEAMHLVIYEDKNEVYRFLHSTLEGAHKRVMETAEAQLPRWEEWGDNGIIENLIVEGDADAIIAEWHAFTQETELFMIETLLVSE